MNSPHQHNASSFRNIATHHNFLSQEEHRIVQNEYYRKPGVEKCNRGIGSLYV